MGLWATIDARGRDPTIMVGGIPLLVRNIRQAARHGWSGLEIWVASENEAAVLNDWLETADLAVDAPRTVRIVGHDESPPQDRVVLLANALYRKKDLETARPGSPPNSTAVVAHAGDIAVAQGTAGLGCMGGGMGIAGSPGCL